MTNEFRIEAADRPLQGYKPLLVKKSKQLAVILKLKKPVDVFLVNAETMRKLNRKYRRKNKTTNVLSFAAPLHFPTDSLGEVYLDPKYIERKKEDLVFMLIHGVLHILGYDHERKSDRMRMERKEAALLSKLKKADGRKK